MAETAENGEHRNGSRAKTTTELAVELTVAWLRRVEGTAEGREPKEVVVALDEFHAAVDRHIKEDATKR